MSCICSHSLIYVSDKLYACSISRPPDTALLVARVSVTIKRSFSWRRELSAMVPADAGQTMEEAAKADSRKEKTDDKDTITAGTQSDLPGSNSTVAAETTTTAAITIQSGSLWNGQTV